MIVAGCQLDLAWEDRAHNHALARDAVARAAGAGARLVVLPEMFASAFSMDTDKVGEPPTGPSATLLGELALVHKVWVCGSIAIRPAQGDGRCKNRLLLFGPAGEAHHYDKIHPFTFANEHQHYAPGDAYTTVTVEGVRATFFICYDLRFANEFWATANDTDLYVVIANWPARRSEHWRTLLRARAIENQAWVLGVNRVGEGNGLAYLGDSAAFDPWGECVASARRDPALILPEITPQRVADARAHFPVLQDRR